MAGRYATRASVARKSIEVSDDSSEDESDCSSESSVNDSIIASEEEDEETSRPNNNEEEEEEEAEFEEIEVSDSDNDVEEIGGSIEMPICLDEDFVTLSPAPHLEERDDDDDSPTNTTSTSNADNNTDDDGVTAQSSQGKDVNNTKPISAPEGIITQEESNHQSSMMMIHQDNDHEIGGGLEDRSEIEQALEECNQLPSDDSFTSLPPNIIIPPQQHSKTSSTILIESNPSTIEVISTTNQNFNSSINSIESSLTNANPDEYTPSTNTTPNNYNNEILTKEKVPITIIQSENKKITTSNATTSTSTSMRSNSKQSTPPREIIMPDETQNSQTTPLSNVTVPHTPFTPSCTFNSPISNMTPSSQYSLNSQLSTQSLPPTPTLNTLESSQLSNRKSLPSISFNLVEIFKSRTKTPIQQNRRDSQQPTLDDEDNEEEEEEAWPKTTNNLILKARKSASAERKVALHPFFKEQQEKQPSNNKRKKKLDNVEESKKRKKTKK